MKKTIALMLTAMLAFVSCNNHDFEALDGSEYAKAMFQDAFISEFGQPAADQDWGFNNVEVFDYTNIATTRGANVEGNLWYKKYERPVNVTEAEKAKVLREFSIKRENTVNEISLPFDCYWVQQVHQGTEPSLNGNGKEVFPKDVMNQLLAYNFNTNSYEHVNNFNTANNTTEYTDDESKEKFIGTTLMENMGEGDNNKQFGYHNTQDSKYRYEYIVLEIDGNYYVGFDIVGYHPKGQDQNYNMDVNRDWVFNDWIVKITPAAYNVNGGKRIIAEDLGGSKSDFDYNDVVFDVKLANDNIGAPTYANKLVGYCVLRAAGGTLPLTIGGKEVHNLFKVNTNVMVNTGAGPNKKPVGFKLILGETNYNLSREAAANIIKGIPILVQTSNSVISLETETGKAPEKIAVETRFVWQVEYRPIYEKYPYFKKWVEDKSYVWY